MKSIKIILIIIAVTLIGFCAWKWIIPKIINPPIPQKENQFTKKIKQEIDSLKKMPENGFCKEFYEKIQYHIRDYHKKGFLGETEKENNQRQDIFSRNLYSAYCPKFQNQAFYVFNNTNWNTETIKFIDNERKELTKPEYLKDGYLEKNKPIYNKFEEIKNIIDKYYEILGFIGSCQNYYYPNNDLNANFPIDEMQKKIGIANAYLNNNLDNKYVNNCQYLKDNLLQIPPILLDKHKKYLSEKIQNHAYKFGDSDIYNGDYNEYKKKCFDVIKSQIKNLENNNIYRNNNCDDLTNKLNEAHNEAYGSY